MGYLSRLAQVNGLRVDALVAHAMLRSEYVPTLGWDYSRLNPILGECLLPQDFGYRIVGSAKGVCKINGHIIPSHHVDAVKARICPDCIQKIGYVPIVWDLRGYVACHIHHRMMLKWCPGCETRIATRRSQLLSCKCGYNFLHAPVESVSPELVAVSELIWAKASGDKGAIKAAAKLGMPVPELLALDLDLMCRLFVSLAGVMTTLACGSRVKGKGLRVVPHLPQIGWVLSRWPANLRSFCGRWTKFQLARSRNSDTFQMAFYWLFYTLCKNSKARKDQFHFLVKEVLAYGRLEWREKPVGVRDAAMNEELPPQRYISSQAAAAILGLPSYGAIRWFKKGRLAWTVIGKDRKGKLVVDREKVRLVKMSQFPPVEARKASRMLGIPHKALRILRENGQLVNEYQTTVEGAISVEDIDAFERGICDVAILTRSNSRRFPLTEYLYSAFPTALEKVALVTSIRNGATPIYYCGEPSFRGLYVDLDLISEAKRKRREERDPSLLSHVQRVYGIGFREAKATLAWLGLSPGAPVGDESTSTRKLSKFFAGHILARVLAKELGISIRAFLSTIQPKDLLELRYRNCESSKTCVAYYMRLDTRDRSAKRGMKLRGGRSQTKAT